MCGKYCLWGSLLEMCEKIWKTAVFPDGYGRIGEILHGQLQRDSGLEG